MIRQRNSIFTIAILGVLVAFMGWVLSLGGTRTDTYALAAPTAMGTALPTMPVNIDGTATWYATMIGNPTIEVIDRRYILAGKSPEQIGQYAVEHLVPLDLGSHGPVEVLLARTVARDEVPQLGLGCLVNSIPIEEPPYVLLILRGNFDYVFKRPRNGPVGVQFNYAAMIIDVWSAEATVLLGSGNGGDFREALNDPSLPEPSTEYPRVCPTPIHSNLPHGAVLPGVMFPTTLPEPTIVIPTIPPPVGTVPVPTSLPIQTVPIPTIPSP